MTGAPWSPTTVKRLLTSGRIAGQRTHHGQVTADATWPAIITPKEAERLQAILGAPRTRDGRAVRPRSYLLSGLVACGACGARLTARPVKRKGNLYRRYACAVDRGGCGRVGIGAGPLEDLVVEAVLRQLDSPSMARALGQADDDTVVELRTAVADDRAALAELTQARYVDRIIGQAEFAAARSRLEDRLEFLEAELGRRSAGAPQWVGRGSALRDGWAGLDLDRRRAVVASVVDRVSIAATTRANNRFDPERVDVTWRV